jgi:hypothetical protein
MSFKQRMLDEQIFTCDGWDDNGYLSPQFYNVELLVQVGEFPAGTKFPVVFFNGEKSLVSFCDENDKHHTYELHLSVGKKIEENE